MSDLELKQQDELVNTMIAHYQTIIDGYKKSIEDIKAEIQQVVEEEADDERWSRGLHYALKIIDKHTGKEQMNE